MSLSEHLGELRQRLLKCTISVVVLGGASLVFAKAIYGLLMRPVLNALPPEASALVYTSAIEEINVYMKVGLYSGVFLTTPVILWQIWGFVAPGLYTEERKMASPFIFFGTVAFLAGAAFCYFGVLPTMFQFLLREESAVAIEARLNVARYQEEDTLRFLRLGEWSRAGVLAKEANEALEKSGEGQTEPEGMMGLSLLPKPKVEVVERLEGLGRLLDAVAQGAGESARSVLIKVLEKRREAAQALANDELGVSLKALDEGMVLLASAVPAQTADINQVWRLERNLGAGKATYEASNWTRPMLSMSEQLTLVLVLELAFGVIFEMPLVMALLALVGLVKSSFLFKYQRHAFVVCLILAAVITPTGDAVNLSLMAGPMLACYELGVLLVWVLEKRRQKKAEQPDDATPA
ncbi:MAG: twin-arginine translocase subunit TatC [Myxococcaceae bacterium]|nr:twin-arginine translocase subunit TatC [Myxococcaceae bacterium]